MHLGPGGGEGFGTRIRTGKAQHRVPRLEEILDDGSTDEARGPGDENAHGRTLSVKSWEFRRPGGPITPDSWRMTGQTDHFSARSPSITSCQTSSYTASMAGSPHSAAWAG